MQEREALPYPPALNSWGVVGVLLLAYIVSLLDRQILALMIDPISRDLGLSDVEMGLLHGTAFVMFYATLGFVMGRVADRYNRRNLIILGITIWCFATIASGFADSFLELFLARMMLGAGEAALAPAAYSMIADIFPPEKRGRASGTFSMGIFMGAGISMIFGGIAIAITTTGGPIDLPLAGERTSWQATFIIVGLPGLLIAGMMAFVREPARRERAGADAGSLSAAAAGFMRGNALLLTLMVAGFALNNMASHGLNSWLPTFFIRNFGWTPQQFGTMYGIMLLVLGSAGIMFGGWLADRLLVRGRADAPLFTVQCAMTIMTLAAFGLALVQTPSAIVAVLCLFTFVVAIPAGLAPVAIYQIVPNEYRGQLIAIYLLTAAVLGLGLSPVLIAGVSEYVFRDELALGKSAGLTGAAAGLAGTICIMAVRRLIARRG